MGNSEDLSKKTCAKMTTANFLKDLPTYNQENFSKIHDLDVSQTPTQDKRQTKYVPTEDYSLDEQEIVTEKTNILLRYLHQQLDKKLSLIQNNTKREASKEPHEVPLRKKVRLDLNLASGH